MKVGDLVFDWDAGQLGVIITDGVAWLDSDGQQHKWDFELLAEGQILFADSSELKIIQKA